MRRTASSAQRRWYSGRLACRSFTFVCRSAGWRLTSFLRLSFTSALTWGVAQSFFFFFSSRRRHTRSDRDWSSDVCSSDLVCVDRTLSALSEISYYLDMGYAMGLISKEEHQVIESLSGRALFYSMKLVMSLAGGSPDETRPPS